MQKLIENVLITIIIPTYNRPDYLKRILNYYNECGINYKIIVADSSLPKNKEENRKIIQSLPNLDILYLGDYPDTISQFYKTADVLEHVKSRYCVMCADDDFITASGINQSVDFLEKNPDFTVAQGDYISFGSKADNKGFLQFVWVYEPYKSITFPDANERFIFHFLNYHPTFYAVHRTDFLKFIFKETIRFTNDGLFGELLPTMLTLIYGKMKHLDVLYAAREKMYISIGEKRENLIDFMKAGTYHEKYAKYRDCLVLHLSKESQLDVGDSKKAVDRSISAYMDKCYHPNFEKKMYDILGHLRLPYWIDEGIRTSYRTLFHPKIMRVDDFTGSGVIPSSKYYDDFDRIRRHVLLYSAPEKRKNKHNLKPW